MITGREPDRVAANIPPGDMVAARVQRVTRQDQQSIAGHGSITVWLQTGPDIAYRLERRLFEAGYRVHVVPAGESQRHLPEVCCALNDAGVIALIWGSSDPEPVERVRQSVGAETLYKFKRLRQRHLRSRWIACSRSLPGIKP